jgi:hypothetical protein
MKRVGGFGHYGGVAIFVLLLSGVAALLVRDYWESITDSYAAMAAANSVIRYCQNNNSLPNSWKDLESEMNEIKSPYGFSNVTQIQSRVSIQFESLQNWGKSGEIIKLRSNRLVTVSIKAANDWIVRELESEH